MVADGTAAARERNHADYAFMLADFATVRVTSGSRPGPELEDMVNRITSPLLLVTARGEYEYGVKYDRAARNRPLEHWSLPDATHTNAIREAAPQYERRVTSFFDQALGRESTSTR